jgi:hypothetical protein
MPSDLPVARESHVARVASRRRHKPSGEAVVALDGQPTGSLDRVKVAAVAGWQSKFAAPCQEGAFTQL